MARLPTLNPFPSFPIALSRPFSSPLAGFAEQPAPKYWVTGHPVFYYKNKPPVNAWVRFGYQM